MKNYLIADRYAKGLSRAITGDAELEVNMQALCDFSQAYEENHDLRSVLANPSIDVARRTAVLKEALDAAGVPAAVQRLAEVLLRRGRITLLPDVAQVFADLTDARLNRVGAKVTTAVDIDRGQSGHLSNVLAQYSGKTIRLESAVDPAILGGVVARIGSLVIDGSVRTQLERMRSTLLSEEHDSQ